MNIALQQARAKSGLTQVQVAEKARISEISYQRIEYGSQTPSLYTAILIAKALDTTVEQLFAVVDEAPISQEQNNTGSRQNQEKS